MAYVPGIGANTIAVFMLLAQFFGRSPEYQFELQYRYNFDRRLLRNLVLNIAIFLSLDTMYQILRVFDDAFSLALAFTVKNLYFAENSFLVFQWTRYVGYTVWDDDYPRKKHRYFFAVIFAANLTLVLLNFCWPVLFQLGNQGDFLVCQVGMLALTFLNYASTILSFLSLLSCRQRIAHDSFVLLAFYPVFPVIGEILQTLNRDVDFMSFYAISACIILRIDAMNAALRDPLTGIGNRLLLESKLKKWFTNSSDSYITGIMIDVDGLRQINQNFGHSTGDKAILKMAEVISEASRLFKILPIRYGGDEFILAWAAKSEQEQNQILAYLQKNRGRLLEGFPKDMHFTYTAGSVVRRPGENMSAEDFLWLLDRKMYAGKQEVSRQIEDALANNRMYIVFQPIFSVVDGRFTRAEVLLRMRDANGDNVPPDRFIPEAEKSGSIYLLERFVLESVCAFISGPEFASLGLDSIAVNLSAVDAERESTPDYIINTVDSFGIPRNKICLELTETAISSSHVLLTENIKKLDAAGFQVFLDDFGTGYSNMLRISKLPLSLVKIDRQMIASPDTKLVDSLRCLVNLIKGMHLPMVAEGVETQEQAEFVKELGVQYIQGFLYARPMPEQDFVQFLKENQ